jgi:hypothetical protein
MPRDHHKFDAMGAHVDRIPIPDPRGLVPIHLVPIHLVPVQWSSDLAPDL